MKKNSKAKTYYSFDEIGQDLFGLKPTKKVTKDKQKLQSQREKFLGVCPYCKQPPVYIYGTNVVACQNEKCVGKKITYRDESGEEVQTFKPFIKTLSEKGTEIAMNIFE